MLIKGDLKFWCLGKEHVLISANAFAIKNYPVVPHVVQYTDAQTRENPEFQFNQLKSTLTRKKFLRSSPDSFF